MNRIIILVAVLFTSLSSFAQYKIEASVRGTKPKDKCILANYFGTSLYTKDTTIVGADGRMVFEGKEPLPQGIYSLVLPDKKNLIQLIISEDQTFSVIADTNDVVGLTKITGSRENEGFYGFQQFMRTKGKEMQALNQQKPAPADLKDRMKKLGDERVAYQDKFSKEFDGTFLRKLFKMSEDGEIPPAPKLPNGRIDSTWQFYYYRAHYWDNFDFTDDRLTRTPVVQDRLMRYLMELHVQSEDSLIAGVDRVIKKAIDGKNKDVISYFIYQISTTYENSKQVGVEGVGVHVFEKYYLTGIMPLSDSATTNKSIRERLATIKPLLNNRVIPNLSVRGQNGRLFSIHDNPAIFKVLVFYSPSCSHCREEAPKLMEFYNKNKLKGVSIMTIATQESEEDWKKFIKEFKWEPLANGYGLVVDRQVDYRKEYDVFATPTLFILDEKNKIVARRVGVADLEPFFKIYLERRKATEKKKS